MRRRSLLAAISAGLAAGPAAGCLSPASPGGSPSPSTGTTATDPSTGTAPPTGTTPSTGEPTTAPSTTTPAPDGGEEFAVTGFDVATSKVAPTRPYYLRITHVYSDDAVEREGGDPMVRDLSELSDPELRAAVEEVLSEGKLWRDEVPDGLEALTREVDFFTWEANTDPTDTATHWRIAVYRAHPDRDPAVEFVADLVDDRITPGDPGAIEFSLTNTGDETQTVTSGTVPPFGVVWADGPGEGSVEGDEKDDRALLWRNYTEEGCVNFAEIDGDSVISRCDIGKMTPIAPGETVARRYELRSAFDHDALVGRAFDAPGRYTVSQTLQYEQEEAPQGPWTEVEWTVSFDLEER